MKPSVPSEPIIRCARMSTGSLEIDQRIEAVAGGVLDAELVADAAGQRRVFARRARRARPAPRPSSGRCCDEGGAAGGIARVEHACRRPAPRACRPACGSCFAPCRSTCRWRCWRRCRRSSPRRSTPGRGRSCGRAAPARGSRRRRSRRAAGASVAASSATRMPRQPSPSITSTESLSAWPDRLVPAARKVSGVRAWRSIRASAAARLRFRPPPRACGTSR